MFFCLRPLLLSLLREVFVEICIVLNGESAVVFSISRAFMSLIRLNQSNHLHVHTNHILVYHGNSSRALFSASALAPFAASMFKLCLCRFVMVLVFL